MHVIAKVNQDWVQRDFWNESVLTKDLLKRSMLPKRTLKFDTFFLSFPKGLAADCKQFELMIPSLQTKELTRPEVKVILLHLNRKQTNT